MFQGGSKIYIRVFRTSHHVFENALLASWDWGFKSPELRKKGVSHTRIMSAPGSLIIVLHIVHVSYITEMHCLQTTIGALRLQNLQKGGSDIP